MSEMEGKRPRVGEGPTQTRVRHAPGSAQENETTPPEMRKPQGAPVSEGPNMVVENGRTYYKAASYSTPRGNIRSDR